jgi:fructokinase
MRIGVDLGGTKIEVIALESDGCELLRERTSTPSGDYEGTVRAVRDLVLAAERRLDRTGTVGIATPGARSALTGQMKNCNSTVLNGRALERDLAEALARPVRLENDANCFALSEAVDGAGAGAKVVFGVILGTGVGGGVVIERQILTGRNHIAGEWGHNPLPWAQGAESPGEPCYCGRRGCIETFLSGAGLMREYARLGGVARHAQAVVEAATAGEPAAKACLSSYCERLARALAALVNVLDPDVIVLGGGLSNVAALYAALPPLMTRYVFSDGLDTPVLAPRYGDSSGVRGAAWLWSGTPAERR